MFLAIWLVTAITALIFYLRRTYSKIADIGVRHLPPIPFFGNLFWMTLKRESMLDVIGKSLKAFPKDRVIGQYELMEPVYIINDLELMKKITLKDFDHFVDRHGLLLVGDSDPLIDRNLVVLEGNEWKAMRSTLSPAFTSSKIRLMVPLMVEVGEQMIDFLKQKIEKSGGSLDIESKDLATRYSNDVIASCAFGLKIDSYTEPNNSFYKRASEITTVSFRRLTKIMLHRLSPFITKIFRLQYSTDDEVKFYKELVLGNMKYREDNKIIRNDMIDILLQIKKGQLTRDDKDEKDEGAGFATVEESHIGKKHNKHKEWTDMELVAQAVLFVFGGYEGVSSTMSFILHELALNPVVQERLYQEIMENEERNDGKFDYNSVQYMKYLDMVVSETMRLWPTSVFTNRRCVKAYNIGKAYDGAPKDCVIPAGAHVVLPIWFTHHNPEYYPNPTKFDPERFSNENKHNINSFTYQPFGMGPRNCIGSRFALCQVKVMIYQLLQHFAVSPAKKTSNPAELTKDSFVLHIKGGAWVKLTLR